MRVPFANEFNEAFESGNLVVKLVAGALFGLFLGIYISVKIVDPADQTFSVYVRCVGGSVVACTLIALVLTLKDVAAKRLARGKRVSPFLKLAGGCVWFLVLTVVVSLGILFLVD